jgi:hypothetical protein
MTAQSIEKRLVFRVLDCWRERRGGRTMPREYELAPADLGPDAPYCFGLTLASAQEAWFTYVGAAFAESRALLGCASSTCAQENLLAAATIPLKEVVERAVPICIGGLSRHLGRPVLFRSILLPLASATGAVSDVVGAANFRVIEGSVGLSNR